MKKFVEESKETQMLTDAIRKLGTPYVSNEPRIADDAVYWANFRVRVMDRISEIESRKVSSLPDRIRDFIAGHVLGTSLSAATLAILVALAVIVKPFGGQSPQMTAIASLPAATAPVMMPQLAQVTEPATASAPVANDLRQAHSIAQKSEAKPMDAKPADDLALLDMPESENLAAQPVFGASDADHPASLDELSQPELESLLKSMESTE